MTAQAHPLVSIVTPVYNGEKYLAECIASVLGQTYPHWEYTIVNNCSRDRTCEIVEEYARRDARIRLHNNTEFVSSLRNHNIAFSLIGLDSRYCKVVHADDWLFPECLRLMVELAEANPSVGVVGAYGLRGRRVAWDGLPYPSTVLPGRTICRETLLGGPYAFGSPTSVLYQADLVRKRKVVYNEANVNAADGEACFDMLQESDFGFVHQVLTYTREHEGSQSSAGNRINPYLLGQLTIFTRYGPALLSPSEYDARLRYWMQRYYQFLGQSVLQRRDQTFWDYHRDGLKRLGLSVSRLAVARASLVEVYAWTRAVMRGLLRGAQT